MADDEDQGGLHIPGVGYLVVPTDVTAYEAARLAEFLGKMTTVRSRWSMPDLVEVVKQHGLQRFFKEKQK